MTEVDPPDGIGAEVTTEQVLAQLDLLTRHDVFRSSKRSIEFLKYVVRETLQGAADQIKERTIGTEVFGRSSSYDTNLDHVVRTAATELRKRLTIYYGDEKHRSELRIAMVPGSYIPKFSAPPPETHPEAEAVPYQHLAAELAGLPGTEQGADSQQGAETAADAQTHRWNHWRLALLLSAAVFAGVGLGYFLLHKPSPEHLFWQPVLDTPGPVLLAVGDVPNGPPTAVDQNGNQNSTFAIQHSVSSRSVPFADMVTIAKVVGVLEASGKKVLIRRENSSSFSDLREGPVVLVGAFNNEWSLRLTRQLRYTLALDAENHLIYIKDAKNPGARNWSWGTNQPREHVGEAGSPVLHDYALISRIRNSETGHVLVVIGGLYTYGTESAGEFLTDPKLMQVIAQQTHLGAGDKSLQIVLGTTVTDGTPGPPEVLAVSAE
jgi:hypothetical protein